MERDTERVERIQQALVRSGLDAVAATLPINVLLLSGYWPVVGDALAIVTQKGEVAVLAPEDERDLAERGWQDTLRTFQPGSLHHLQPVAELVREPLAGVAAELGLGKGSVIGFESAAEFTPCSYAAMYHYGTELRSLLQRSLPGAALLPAASLLADLRAVLTQRELTRIRLACRIAERAYLEGRQALRAGPTEGAAAARFQAPLIAAAEASDDTLRAGGFVFCMAGANAAHAHASYQRSRRRPLAAGDLVLVHCNSYLGGYWTDITRTFCLGEPDSRQRHLYQAVLTARQAALASVRPGTRAAAVDRAARQALQGYGLGSEFKHGTGHGVGFAAIDHTARPQIHPASDEVLEVGMTFNLEPAVYVEGYGGIRHCDMVTVTRHGAELLTPFLSDLAELTISLPS